MLLIKRDGKVEQFDIKKLQRSIKVAYNSVHKESKSKASRQQILSVTSGICADFIKEGKRNGEQYDTVMLARAAYQRLMYFDADAAISYILFCAAKHWAKETGYVVPPKRMLEIFYNRKDA